LLSAFHILVPFFFLLFNDKSFDFSLSIQILGFRYFLERFLVFGLQLFELLDVSIYFIVHIWNALLAPCFCVVKASPPCKIYLSNKPFDINSVFDDLNEPWRLFKVSFRELISKPLEFFKELFILP